MATKEGAKITDWLLAAFTFALAVVAIYQFIIMRGQLKVMSDDERAWVVFQVQHKEGEDVTSTMAVSPEGILQVPYEITDTGKTPARNIDLRVYYDLTPTGQEPPLGWVDETDGTHPYNDVAGGLIFPNQPIKETGIMPRKGGNRILTTDEKTALQTGKVHLSMFGIVSFDDVFGVKHWTRFCKWFWVAPETNYETIECAHFNNTDGN